MRVSQFVLPELGVIDVNMEKLGTLYVVSMVGEGLNTVQALYERFDYWLGSGNPYDALLAFYSWANENDIAVIDGFDIGFLEDHVYQFGLIKSGEMTWPEMLISSGPVIYRVMDFLEKNKPNRYGAGDIVDAIGSDYMTVTHALIEESNKNRNLLAHIDHGECDWYIRKDKV